MNAWIRLGAVTLPTLVACASAAFVTLAGMGDRKLERDVDVAFTIGVAAVAYRSDPSLERRLQQRLEMAHVAAVGDLHRGLHEHARIGEREILDSRRDQRLVRHDRLASAERADDGVARADVGDAALEGINPDHVADPQAPL